VRFPYRTFNHLVESLRPGMVGCLRTGTYGDRSTVQAIDRSGLPGRRIVITGVGKKPPTIAGAVFVSDRADYVTLRHVAVEGANNLRPNGRPEAMEVWGRHFIFEDSTLTNRNAAVSGIIFKGDGTVIRRNKIHDVGGDFGYDHGIYVSTPRNFKIEYNWIYDCHSGWGISLYPNAVRGSVSHNIIDGCGSGITIGRDGDHGSHDNRIDHNLITNSIGLGHKNEGTGIAGCCGTNPDGNVVIKNMFWGNAGGAFDQFVGKSYVVDMNFSSNPRYFNRAAKDFRVRARAARALGLWNGVPLLQPGISRTRG
jgi:Right handed beta helix region